MKNILGIIVSYIFIGIIIVFAKFFKKIGEEASRKFIHIMLSNWWFIAMYFFENALWASIVPLSFVVINYISYKKNLILVMERESQDGLGTVYYAISLLILAIITFGITNKPEIGLCSVLIMGYGDGLAAVIGKKVKSYEYKIGNTKKTLVGSLTMFVITFITIAIYLGLTGINLWAIKSIVTAIILTIIEAVSIKGTDNITIPISACTLLFLM
ncbi:MAG: hypothetical protein HFJ41_06075 [Clostridia bacterium]|nr:hypothetical protein [Clostridia bacterium]